MTGPRERSRHLRLVRPGDVRRLGEAEVWRRVGSEPPDGEPVKPRVRRDAAAVGRRVTPRLVVIAPAGRK
jgi:hypothetical protein